MIEIAYQAGKIIALEGKGSVEEFFAIHCPDIEQCK